MPLPLSLLVIALVLVAGYFLGYHDGVSTVRENENYEDQGTNPQA